MHRPAADHRHVRVSECVRVCAPACARAIMCARVRACVRACEREGVCVCVCDPCVTLVCRRNAKDRCACVRALGRGRRGLAGQQPPAISSKKSIVYCSLLFIADYCPFQSIVYGSVLSIAEYCLITEYRPAMPTVLARSMRWPVVLGCVCMHVQ